MRKPVLKVVEQQGSSYTLTREEYEKLCTAFYRAQSLIRIITKVEIEDLDASNVCDVVLDQLKIIEPLLGK